MPDDNSLTYTRNAIPHSSNAMDHTQTSSYNSLLMGSKQIPLLRAYSGSSWVGITTSYWVKLLEEQFLADNITTDASKINIAWRHIHTSKGSARSILTHNIDIRNATTWKTFSETILALLTPSTDANAFLAFSKFSNHSWTQGTPLPVHISQIQQNLDHFLASIKTFCKVDFTERQRFVLLYAKLADSLSASYNRFLLDNFDISLSVTDQQKRYLSKRDFTSSDFSVNALKQSMTKPMTKHISNSQPQFSPIPNNTSFKKFNGNFNKANTTQRRQNFRNNNTSPKFDPHITPFCINCERYGHYTKQCIYKSFCSLCFLYHTRGTQQKCYQTKWDRRSPLVLTRFQLLPASPSPHNFRQDQHSYNKSAFYSKYIKPNHFANSYNPRHHSRNFSNRQQINHVQEYTHDDELTHFSNAEDHSVPYDFSQLSHDLQDYSLDSVPS